MGSKETVVLRLVLWLISRYLATRYRLMTPEDLNKVVDDYLAELPKLGINLVYARNQVGESNDQVNDPDQSAETAGDPPRVPDVRQGDLV